MHPSDHTASIPSSLSEQLHRRTDELLCKTIRTNYDTRFVRDASEFAEFRRTTGDVVDGVKDDTLSDIFRKTVQFTTYDSYAPFIARFFERPCRGSTIVNLLAPGLPDYLAVSSSTSGGLPKFFPKYNHLKEIRALDGGSQPRPDPPERRTISCMWYLSFSRLLVEGENTSSGSVSTIYRACGTVVSLRKSLKLDPEKDEERMGKFVFGHAAPYAAGFIKKWRAFLLIHALFAISSRSLEKMSMVFISTFVDMMRYLDEAFDTIVDCIEHGVIPDLDGLEDVRRYLEPNISPDPDRATELRSLGRPSSRQGWCSYVWPKLHTVIGIASGSFASSMPLVRWYLGSNTDIHTHGYGSTEAHMGNPLELNRFKLTNLIVIEFLDISQMDDLINAVAQLWEVEVGKRYEPLLTTQDGLWRYRVGDVVEIVGFDPTDGTPIIQFVERRNVVIRFADFMLTEKELRAAMGSVPQTILTSVVDWTTIIDDRHVPSTIGFFVELVDGKVPDLATSAPDHLLGELSGSNENVGWAFEHGLIREPTVRIVRPGTFSSFRQLKLDEMGDSGLGQVKVPVVLPKAEYVTWFSDRVLREL